MNVKEKEIMNILLREKYVNQRVMSEISGYSLGTVNQSLKKLQEKGYLTENMELTIQGTEIAKENRVRNAIILAAGCGMRMVPINTSVSKGLLSVRGEILIERTICQLQEAGITDITIVVGFMKESYEYLIDKYHVKLKVNAEYAIRNNLHSLALVSRLISHTYIIPSDIWCGDNPFHSNEMYSWYMISNIVDDDSTVRVNRKQELTKTKGTGNQMIGIAYIDGNDSKLLQKNLLRMDGMREHLNCFWEDALYEGCGMYVSARLVDARNVYEINTYEQLREIDSNSEQLQTEVINLVAEQLHEQAKNIIDIEVLKKGMTNRSFTFRCKNKKYIMRIPGEGTQQLIDRQQEYDVYQKIRDLQLCDDIFYINPQNGYKLTAFITDARTCDPKNLKDVRKCMKVLRNFHEAKIQVPHQFDIFEQIEFYESLWNGKKSCFHDYSETKRCIWELKEFIDQQDKEMCLTHIDAVPDNFLFSQEGEGEERIRLIDWEYAGMQDPHVDIAMFAIYSMYDKSQVDELIDAYFVEGCDKNVRRKIYSYIAACGLLWSNWCEYKRQLGVEFGEYSLKQYRYAKEYYRIWLEENK